jgi:DsbC/DsbD-like thiol-disulfide interchange protein
MRTTAVWKTAMRGALCALAIAASAATGAWAGGFPHSEVRLLQGEFADNEWSAGVQIDLAEGWKTYWRMPGEAGIAPEFDWSGSHNVADVVVRWPAPGRYHDASGETIGYAHRVVFPLSVLPENASEPVELALELSYAVCKDICVPARVELRRTLGQSSAMSSVEAALVRQFAAQVPHRWAAGVALERAHVEAAAGAPVLAVELTGAAVDSSTEIFVEGLERAYFRAPRLVSRSGDTALFHLAIDDLADPDLLRGHTLRLTVVTATAQLVGDVTVE